MVAAKANPSARLMRELDALDRFTMAGLDAAVDRLRNGGGLVAFEAEVLDHLQESHTRGVVLGRHWAGDRVARERDDEIFAGRAVERELAYFDGLLHDIRTGRYDDDEIRVSTALDARLRLYGKKVGGTMSEVFVLASPADSVYDWVMLADEHCQDCPRIAAGGPYAADGLPTYPRAGQTQCLTNCKCVLVRRSDGMPSPPPFGL